MISFSIITSTPTVVRNFLINRGILQQVTGEGGTALVGVLPGLEWVEVPNPIAADTRHVYLVKFAHQDQDDQQSGITQTVGSSIPLTPAQILNNTKFGQWVAANGARNDLSVNGTTVPAYQITGQQIWVAVDTAGLFGTWQ